MSPSLGEKLKAAREQRGISISEVAEQTRISPLYLHAIEADNYKTLPGGIFNKGFVRSYAKYVGIDEQEALQDYSRLIAQTEPVVEEEFKTYRPEVLTDDRAASSIVPTVIFAAVILGLMTAGILFLVNYIQNQQSEPQIAANTNNTNSAVVATNMANQGVPTPANAAPSMASLKVEFTASGDEVWLRSVTDGKSSEALVKPGNTVSFEPKESLRIRYSRSRAQFAQLTLNGKSIALPKEPGPGQANIELNINQSNLAQIWESGRFGSDTAPTTTSSETPAPTATRAPARPSTASRPAAALNSNSAVPPMMTDRPAPRPATTPAPQRPPANTEN